MLPLGELEWPVADERRRLGPLVATLGDVGLTRGDADPQGGDRVEVRRLLGQLEGDVVAAGGDAELGLRGRELGRRRLLRVEVVVGLAADDDVTGEGVVARDVRVAEASEAERVVLRGDGGAVGVLEAVTERVGVGEAVGRDGRLGLRGSGDRLQGRGVVRHEGLEDHHGLSDLVDERLLLRIDGVGLATGVGVQLTIRVGGRGVAGIVLALSALARCHDHRDRDQHDQDRPKA